MGGGDTVGVEMPTIIGAATKAIPVEALDAAAAAEDMKKRAIVSQPESPTREANMPTKIIPDPVLSSIVPTEEEKIKSLEEIMYLGKISLYEYLKVKPQVTKAELVDIFTAAFSKSLEQDIDAIESVRHKAFLKLIRQLIFFLKLGIGMRDEKDKAEFTETIVLITKQTKEKIFDLYSDQGNLMGTELLSDFELIVYLQKRFLDAFVVGQI
ncbi:MAG: hypothetical protein ABIM99_06305 [Candidatus Dojkabacteria bacterium]